MKILFLRLMSMKNMYLEYFSALLNILFVPDQYIRYILVNSKNKTRGLIWETKGALLQWIKLKDKIGFKYFLIDFSSSW